MAEMHADARCIDVPDTRVEILHVVPAYHPARGGVEVLVEELAIGLRERHGLRSAVLAPALPGQRAADHVHLGTRVHSVAVTPQVLALADARDPQPLAAPDTLAFMSEVFTTVRRVMRECSPSVVHVHASSLLARPAMAIAASLGIEVVIHIHGAIHSGDSPTFRRQIRYARWVCAVSQAVRDSIHRDCGRIGPVTVIRNGLADPFWQTIPFEPYSPSVAMVGRLTYEKGFDDGLRALRIVRDRYPALEVRLVGIGPMVADLHSLAEELGMVDCIRYFGELEHQQGMRVMAGADVVLVPSSGIEGFGLVAAEAALLERPVVATRAGGLPETVVDGVTGLIVAARDVAAMADAVSSLLAEPGRRAMLGVTARQRALAEFGMDRCVDEVADLYGLIGVGGGPG